jgi:hypothetical protein
VHEVVRQLVAVGGDAPHQVHDLSADGGQMLAGGDAVTVARGPELGEPSLSRSFARSA